MILSPMSLAVPALGVSAGVVLAVDGALIAADVLHRAEILHDERFRLTRERGYAEFVQYGKGAALAIALLVFAWRRRCFATFFWGAILAAIVVDDAFALHERAGLWVAARVPVPEIPPLRPSHLVEVVLLGAGALSIFAAGAWAWRRRPRAERPVLLAGGAGMAVLAFFGIVMDFAHSAARHHWLREIFAVLEEGGELVALTALGVGLLAAQRPGGANGTG